MESKCLWLVSMTVPKPFTNARSSMWVAIQVLQMNKGRGRSAVICLSRDSLEGSGLKLRLYLGRS